MVNKLNKKFFMMLIHVVAGRLNLLNEFFIVFIILPNATIMQYVTCTFLYLLLCKCIPIIAL